jgi:hypothetical protein
VEAAETDPAVARRRATARRAARFSMHSNLLHVTMRMLHVVTPATHAGVTTA